jgi:ABC-2 type transport system ATP-binding protein
MGATELSLKISNVSKAIAGREVLSNCTLEIREGEICALIGPNGAGKTTLLKTIAGLVDKTAGEIRMCGVELSRETRDSILPHLGLTVEAPAFPPNATAREALVGHFAMFDHEPVDEPQELLRTVGLESAADSLVGSFSLGMRQRLALAEAIGHRPRMLALDEPANGLDPGGVVELRKILSDLSRSGVSVLVASHVLTELERTAHSVVVLDRGRLGRKQAMAEILARHPRGLEGFYQDQVEGVVL